MLKHKLIPKRWGWGQGERRGTQLPMWPGWNLRNTYIWNSALVTIMGTEGHTQVGHPDSRIYSSSHPKNLCYVFIMENNYGSQWWKSLGRAKGKVSLRQTEQPIQWKVKANSANYELKYQCLTSSTHPQKPVLPLCVMSAPKTRGGKEAT